MANATRTVKVRFDGSAVGLTAAAKQAERDLESFRKKASSFNDGAIKFGAITGLVGALGALAGPAVAGGVAALGSLGAAGGVLALAFSGVGDAVDEFNKALVSGDFSKYEAALARMPKSQANFTRELVATQQQFGQLKTTAADNALPGISDALRSTTGLLPTLDAAVKRTGTIISDTGKGLAGLFSSASFKRDLDGFLKSLDPVTKAAGDSLVTLSGRLVTFGAQMAPASQGFASFLRGLTDGVTGFLDGLAPHADDFKSIWESLGDIARDIGPILGDFIGELSKTWAPILRDVADWLGQNKDAIKDFGSALAGATPWLLAVAGGLKALKIANEVKGWIDVAKGALGLFGGAAEGAAGKVGGLKDKIGGMKGLLGGLAFVGAVEGLASIQREAQGANYKISDVDDTLQDMADGFAQLVTKPASVFREIGFEWQKVQNTVSGFKLDPITLQVNGAPARADVAKLLNQVNQGTGTINIDGRTEGAGQALADILQAISLGEATVTIDGQAVPVQQALSDVMFQIDESVGTVDINGNPQPAGGALASLLNQTNSSVGTIQINGNIDPATGKTMAALNFANGSVGTVTLDGNPTLVNGKTLQAVLFADGSRGIVTLDGNPNPANGKVNGVVSYANGRTASVTVTASTGSGQGVIDGFIRRNDGRQIHIFTSVLGSGGIASAGRLATGGPVRGPGTGTSDTAGLFALSNGEHVLTAAEVRAAGGHSAVARMRQALLSGQIRGLAKGGPAVTAPRFMSSSSSPSVSVGAPQVNVQVLLDGEEMRHVARTEIAADNRRTRRLVSQGTGRGV